MSKFKFIVVWLLLVSLFACQSVSKTQDIPLDALIDDALDFSLKQNVSMANSLKDQPNLLPKTLNSSGTLETCKSDWW
jgi:hypothetical protein